MKVGEYTEQFQFTLRTDIPAERAVIDYLNGLPKGRRGQKLAGIVMASLGGSEVEQPLSMPVGKKNGSSFDDEEVWNDV